MVIMTEYSRDDELFACLAFVKARGIGPVTWQKIFNRYGSPALALENSRYWHGEGLVRKNQTEALQSGSWEKEVRQELEVISRKNLRVILWTDPEYPEGLKQISGPPAMMYCIGDASLLKNPGLAVVGSRQCSSYGLRMAGLICGEISAAGMTIVSGFAYGIDRQAHIASVDNPGGTIAVLGTGIDLVYPAVNRELWMKIAEKGLILTEFCPGTPPDPGNFPYRNRIISGLALGVLVVQSAKKSGSMITARLALDQNREVFAVPGAVNMENYDGCNLLIKEGAHLVQNADDILEVLGPMVQAMSHRGGGSGDDHETASGSDRFQGLNPEERQLAGELDGRDQVHIDDLTKKLGWSSQEVSRTLVLLEIKGLVRKSPGMYYSLTQSRKV